MEKKLQKNEILKLIALYKEREALWNMTSCLYRSKTAKNAALQEIAEEMDFPVAVIKKKLKSLRSTYVIEKKKVDKSMECDPPDRMYEPSLFWYNTMSFVDNYILQRKIAPTTPGVNSNNSELNSPTHSTNSTDDDDECESIKLKKRKTSSKCNNERSDILSEFGKSVTLQLRNLPEEEVYPAMADIEYILSLKANKRLTKQSKRKRSSRRLPSPKECTLSSEELSTSIRDDDPLSTEENIGIF